MFNSQFVRENNITLHTFRHTYAHNMLDKGVPKEVLQTLLGHRSIKTTEIYANWISNNELEISSSKLILPLRENPYDFF